jgi:LysM repeat protein
MTRLNVGLALFLLVGLISFTGCAAVNTSTLSANASSSPDSSGLTEGQKWHLALDSYSQGQREEGRKDSAAAAYYYEIALEMLSSLDVAAPVVPTQRIIKFQKEVTRNYERLVASMRQLPFTVSTPATLDSTTSEDDQADYFHRSEGSAKNDTIPVVITPKLYSTRHVVYTVHRGDNLREIGTRYGVSVAELLRQNQISDPNVVQPGTKLYMAVGMSGPTATQSPPAQPDGIKAQHHTVLPGETIWSIARNYGKDPQKILSWNHLKPNSVLAPGQELIISSSVGEIPTATSDASSMSGSTLETDSVQELSEPGLDGYAAIVNKSAIGNDLSGSASIDRGASASSESVNASWFIPALQRLDSVSSQLRGIKAQLIKTNGASYNVTAMIPLALYARTVMHEIRDSTGVAPLRGDSYDQQWWAFSASANSNSSSEAFTQYYRAVDAALEGLGALSIQAPQFITDRDQLIVSTWFRVVDTLPKCKETAHSLCVPASPVHGHSKRSE